MNTKHLYFFLAAAAIGFAMRQTLAVDATGKPRPLFGMAYSQGQSMATPVS